jgi:3'-phosphoadenosine 5'-phosphosulfate sulfotransferase (PAPS reductase)/FAD synthetase
MTDTLHVVALSGGKDSTAMALGLAEAEPRDYMYICTPTGDELPEMFAHWRDLAVLLGRPLTPIMGGTLNGLIAKQNALPNWRMRWCTRMLKIEPYRAWLTQQSASGRSIVSYVGLRADEEGREGIDYGGAPGVAQRFPLREWGWGLRQVREYLAGRGVRIPRRTDCARCFFQTLGEWWMLWKEHPEIYADAEAQEAATGHTFRSPGRDTWPASLRELRAEFERGRAPKNRQAQRDFFGEYQCRVCSL